MTDFVLKTSGLAIPILGICIVLSLGVAAYLEPQKDYSRKTYIQMLFSCAVILLAECFQALPGGLAPAAMRVMMFIFYASLSAICYLWTLYSYYWVSGRPASGKILPGFAAGPVIELILLVINLFTGFFYSVSSDGVYSRGKFFVVYIAFSYLYLICAIVVTAFRAAGTNEKLSKREQALFLLCFLFPVFGPFVQYIFPAMSFMGATEAIALLIVYVSIQQRSAARYAVERARSEDEYRAYEDSLEQLLTAKADALFVLRLNITQNTLNGSRGISESVLRHGESKTLDELREAFVSMITSPEEAAHFMENTDRNRLIEQFKSGNSQFSITYRRKMANGETHLINMLLHMLQNPASGDIEGVLYSADIDRQDKEEKVISAITRREYNYIALIDVETGKIYYQYAADRSDASIRFTLGDYDYLISQFVPDMSDPAQPGLEGGKVLFRTVMDELSRQDECSYVFSYKTLAGDIRQKKLSYRYLDDRNTDILFFVSDVTEEMRQESERAQMLQQALKVVQHADAMKSEFLSNVSHDMRTPLNAILGYTNLARSTGDAAKKDDYLDKIGSAGNIMLELVNDTLDLSKISSGKIILKPEPHLCGEIFSRIVSSIGPSAEAKNIRFTVDCSGAADMSVLVDAMRLQEIVINLLSNAVKFTPENGQVSLRAECEHPDGHIARLIITVRDTGCGMTPEFIAKMYEPFAQERQTADTVGSGLGLAIVKKLVELMNGKISVKSEPGKGTEFTVFLDFELAGMPAQTAEDPEQVSGVLKGRHILLAEDNAMNTEIAKAILESKGMTVTNAQNGQEACRLFAGSQSGFFDAILMDIRMPVMNGRDAAIAIRKMDRPDAAGIPIIAMSADAFDDDIIESLNAGMNAHISKPFQPEKLFSVLKENLRQ